MDQSNQTNNWNDEAGVLVNGLSQETADERHPFQKPVQKTPAEPQPENLIAGIVGAFLFSLLGGLLYFIVYEVGFIAGICGLVIFVLANFGYQLFSGKKGTMKGVIVAVIMMIITTLLAEFICISFEIYQMFKEDFSISFFEAARITPELLKEPEVMGNVVRDILFALILGALAAFSTIRGAIRANRSEKNKAAAIAPTEAEQTPSTDSNQYYDSL